MLDHQLRHDFPSIAGCGVSIMGAVDLGHTGIRHQAFGFRSINEGTHHIHIAIKHIVLGILVSSIDPFFSKQDSDFWSSDAADVRVKIDGTADFVFNKVERFTGGP